MVVAVHVGLWSAAYFLAFGLRFDFSKEHKYAAQMLSWFPILVVLRIIVFQAFGLFRGMWKYTGGKDLVAIVWATSASSILFLGTLGLVFRTFPRSILIIEWAVCIILVGGIRFAYRNFAGDWRPFSTKNLKANRCLIVGAGDAGELLLREVHRNYHSRFQVVGFIDDNREKLHARIHGVRVLGTVEQIPALISDLEVDEVIIAAPTATGAQMRRIVDKCKAGGVRFRTIPGLEQLIDGRVTMNQVRDVAIEDLLGRDQVELDMEAISDLMRGHVVMISGAGGSIGSEMCRQICRFAPSKLLLVERTENNLFHIHRELEASHPLVPLVPAVADVADAARMDDMFRRYRPTVVFHAAAYKHVPMMEWNPGEAVKNNIVGTRTLADAADRYGVERFVMISTDKAVNPTSVMGASKRVAEIYVQSLSQRSATRFVTVRFGNVLGSTGSVIPIFKEQIAAGGPVTVTHPEMKRYFMTIPEACQLVLQAGTMGQGGEIFILDMGQPMKIADLARDLITLSGLTPEVDIEIRFTGVRPGEKLFEELAVDDEAAEKTRHPKIFVGRFRPYERGRMERGIDRLRSAVGQPAEEIRALLRELVPEYQSPEDGARAAQMAHETAEEEKVKKIGNPAQA